MRRSVRGFLFLTVVLMVASSSRAQTCWVYTDTVIAPVPIRCVSKVDLTSNCSWPSDCTSIPASSPQTIREMHNAWHTCFGDVGGSTPPAGRSHRWYAFHRQFEYDFNIWRRAISIDPIEQVDWCPNMLLEVGTQDTGAANPPDNAAGCGGGVPRPPNTPCDNCVSFPQCLFYPGGGPLNCPAVPGCTTPDGSVSFPHASINQFPHIDDVAKILDAQFHGDMHGAVAFGDGAAAYNDDCNSSNCSPRDPMFWRLHHALDDVVRAWQDGKAVDVVVIVDRSGSMSDPDSSGATKLNAALAALDNFADLLEDGRADGQSNRIGVVSYSDAAATNLALTTVNSSLRTPGGPFDNAKTSIASGGPGGCTGIGGALQRAVELLCPPGDCRNFMAGGDNDRKSILLLTDGIENVAPCLQPAGASGGSCGSQCFGATFDLAKLEFTQLVVVGFGSSSNLNGDLLTLVAERQGGIYLQNPATAGNDLKDFFVKAFANLSSEFLLLDPKGTLAPDDAASAPVDYSGCADSMLTFTSGWDKSIAPGAVKLLVTSPSGDLVRASDPGIEASRQALWDFSRIRLPYRGEVTGTWRAQLVRLHNAYVNGFAPDAFADPDEGAALVRREIHRLCPEGCRNVVLFERGLRGPRSAYRDAVEAEKASGLLGNVVEVSDDEKLVDALRRERVDLVVYAQMSGPDRALSYDDLLASYVCRGGRAILTDARPRARTPLFKCAGADAREPVNYRRIAFGDLVTQQLKLVNPGHAVFAHAVGGSSLQAFADKQIAAVAARAERGVAQNWFVDVLGSSLGKLSAHRRRTRWKTGEVPIASVRMLPSYIRAGGWDHVDARVEVEYPRIGEGTLLTDAGLREPRKVKGETIDARSAALAGLTVPMATATFPLFDNGLDPDVHARNGVWSGDLTGLGRTDGTYKLRYIFDLTANGCTTRRELVESIYVEVGVDPKTTRVTTDWKPRGAGLLASAVRLTPVDRLGNPLGPGRPGAVSCQPAEACRVSGQIADDGRGNYSIDVVAQPNVASVRVAAFGSHFDVPVPCQNCPRLERIAIEPGQVMNKQNAKGVVRLSRKAPSNATGGAVVYLSSDMTRVASVPESVLVPAGKTEASFPVTVYHVHERPETVTVEASYGGSRSRAKITVSEPEKDPASPKPPAKLEKKKHQHPE